MEIKEALKNPWNYVVIVLVLFVLFIIYNGFFGGVQAEGSEILGPGEYDDFAKYLTEQGTVMYGAEWCGYCKKQKQMFGNSFQYINYVDCDKNNLACSEAGVSGFPTWSINGENYPGLQQLDKLIELSGYQGEL